jgi:GAF domain-containing protein
LLLADAHGVLHVLASSSEQTRQLELFQLQRAEGPCLDSYQTGVMVAVPDLVSQRDRWPTLVTAAQATGFASLHALPLRFRSEVLGAMGLFGTTPGVLSEQDLLLGQALADVASVALVQDRAAADRDALNEQLQTALSSRLVLEQAKGALAQAGGLDMPRAFEVLRGYARGSNLRLTDVAQAIVDRRLPSRIVLDHSVRSEAP